MSSFESFQELKNSVDKTITLLGTISMIPWQHIVGSFKDYPYAEYFDLPDGFQTIIYTKTKINSDKVLQVRGKIIVVKGRSKRPLDEPNEYFEEYHVLVESYQEREL